MLPKTGKGVLPNNRIVLPKRNVLPKNNKTVARMVAKMCRAQSTNKVENAIVNYTQIVILPA